MSIYKRDSDKTKCVFFFIKDENFFNKYNEIQEKVSNITKKKSIGNLLIYNIKIFKS